MRYGPISCLILEPELLFGSSGPLILGDSHGERLLKQALSPILGILFEAQPALDSLPLVVPSHPALTDSLPDFPTDT